MTILVNFDKSTGKFRAKDPRTPLEEGEGNSLDQAMDDLESKVSKVAASAAAAAVPLPQRQTLVAREPDLQQLLIA
jgi:hypothetical protein